MRDAKNETEPAGKVPRDRSGSRRRPLAPRRAGEKAARGRVVQKESTAATESANVPPRQRIRIKVNGSEKVIDVAPWTTLLDLLRERLDLTGTKKGCDHGQCGSCTVLADGKRILSCMTLALMKDGAEITTIEGLAKGDELHSFQAAFVEHDAFQCGYCTPGQICSGIGLMAEGKARTTRDIAELMSGNICRCGAYSNIVAAIEEVLAAEGAPRE